MQQASTAPTAPHAAASQFILKDLFQFPSVLSANRWESRLSPVPHGHTPTLMSNTRAIESRTKSTIDAVGVFGNFAGVNFSGPNFGSVVAGESHWYYFCLADLRWGLC
jgi:hypothetical protein